MTQRLLLVSGSLRRRSHNSRVLDAAAAALPPAVQAQWFDGLGAVPPYNADVEEVPLSVRRFVEAIAAADAVLFATPEYNASVPGQLKNALDWASLPHAENVLRGKPVAVVGASTGAYGAVWAQAELRKILRVIGARVVEAELAVAHADHAFNAAGYLVSGAHRDRVADVVGALLEEVAEQQSFDAAA